MKVDICYRLRNITFVTVISISVRPDRHVLEVHVILGQGSCFVTKNVLDLAQLFV